MIYQPPQDLLEALRGASSFVIAGHEDPDADCIGSELALAGALRRMGKEVTLCNNGPFKRVEINRYQPLFQSRLDPFIKMKTPLLIVLDCATLERVGAIRSDFEGLKAIVVDHHAVGQPFGDWRWIDAQQASTTWMVHKIICALLGAPNQEEAFFLLLGLCTDTGFFRHCELNSQSVFETTAQLIQCGASPKAVYQQMTGGKFLANQKLMGLILSRTESYWDNQVLFSYENLDDRKTFGAENRESDSIYQSLQSVSGNELIILLRQESPEKVTGGLRSKAFVDVAVLASEFGGGGHIRASGFSCPGKVNEIRDRILEEIKPYFNK
jgi:bifunctional oligoribonuclease and PAP phosphatase NrnA